MGAGIGRSVGIVTILRDGRPRNFISIPGRVRGFLFSVIFRLVLELTQQNGYRGWISRSRAAGGETDHSPPSSAGVKNGGAIPHFPMSSWCDNFTFCLSP